jgi:hypothetical protein
VAGYPSNLRVACIRGGKRHGIMGAMLKPATIAAGDFNLGLAQLNTVARSSDAIPVPGHIVDHALVRNVRRPHATVLSKHGSDHHPVIYTMGVDGFDLRVLSWNVQVGRKRTEVREAVTRLVELTDAHLVLLQETYGYQTPLGKIPGYVNHQTPAVKGRTESGEVATLLRKDLPLLSTGIMRMRRDWIGPKHGLHHDGREYRRLRFELPNGYRVRSLNLHFPTGGVDHRTNGPAVRESIARTERWVCPTCTD